MKRRLSRAKAKIKATRIPFAVPSDHLLPDRLQAVLAVIYLIYNEGYGGRVDLAAEAIRLGRVLVEPDARRARGPRPDGTDDASPRAPRRARFAGEDLVLLADQDRSLWDAGRGGAGPGAARPRDRAARPRAVRDPGGDRLAADRRSRSTGRRSPRSTRSCPSSPARRWSSSIAPWRSPRRARPSRRWSWSTVSSSTTYPLPALDPGRAPAPPRARRGGSAGLRAARSSCTAQSPSAGSSAGGSRSCDIACPP